MGLPSVVNYIQGKLNGLAMPFGAVELAAYITPPDPNVETVIMPTLYVLTAKGPEKRLSMPRNTGPGTGAGDKTISHNLSLHVIWMIANSSPAQPGGADPDLLFTEVMETIMAALRTDTPDPVWVTDPYTGVQTYLSDTGENMTYDYLPRHSIKNQRMLRYDALIDMSVTEVITA